MVTNPCHGKLPNHEIGQTDVITQELFFREFFWVFVQIIFLKSETSTEMKRIGEWSLFVDGVSQQLYLNSCNGCWYPNGNTDCSWRRCSELRWCSVLFCYYYLLVYVDLHLSQSRRLLLEGYGQMKHENSAISRLSWRCSKDTHLPGPQFFCVCIRMSKSGVKSFEFWCCT